MAILLSRRSNRLAVVVLLLCQLFLYVTVSSSGSVLKQGGGEEFSEELLLKPLPDRKVLAHFHFQSRAPHSSSHGRHHHLFPKAIAQLVRYYFILFFKIKPFFFWVIMLGEIKIVNPIYFFSVCNLEMEERLIFLISCFILDFIS